MAHPLFICADATRNQNFACHHPLRGKCVEGCPPVLSTKWWVARFLMTAEVIEWMQFLGYFYVNEGTYFQHFRELRSREHIYDCTYPFNLWMRLLSVKTTTYLVKMVLRGYRDFLENPTRNRKKRGDTPLHFANHIFNTVHQYPDVVQTWTFGSIYGHLPLTGGSVKGCVNEFVQ